MNMLNSIKKYFKRLKEEGSKEYTSHAPPPLERKSGWVDPHPYLPSVWTGIDLDGTLAHWDSGSSIDEVGPAVPAMLSLVKKMINNDMRVKIFTARAQDPRQIALIRKWLRDNGLPDLEITNVKDYYMERLYDDRCVQVERNTGRLIRSK